VERLSGQEGSLRTGDLFIKRDDKSSDEYGGNKVRKLEFILAETVAQRGSSRTR
jgi:1-aminocyclopropane-1-carboxylate deaminase/D-cysteine desulfhydrase-like pyridoxal-dependent ACC family enzyme